MNRPLPESRADLPQEAEVVVVGGGLRGSAITYYLAKAGVDVLQIEREAIGGASSGANQGMINISLKLPPVYTHLSHQSALIYPRLIDELDYPVEFRNDGTVYLLDMEGRASEKPADDVPRKGQREPGEKLLKIKRGFESVNKIEGLEVKPVSAAEVEELLAFRPAHFDEAYYCEADCWVNPLQLNLGLVLGAKNRGATISTNVELTGIKVETGQVRSALTSRGEVRTQALVLSTGVNLPILVRDLQLDIPISSNRGHILVTEAVPPFLGPMAMNIDRSGDSVAMIQTDRGNLLIGTSHEASEDSREVSLERILPIAQRALSVFPILKRVQLIRTWAGIRPWPSDGLPIFERCDNPKGLYIISGHSGVTLAPVTGRIVADWITAGSSCFSTDDFSLARFRRS